MRIKVNFSKNISDVPNNNKVVLEYVHRCLGRNNEYHDKASSYNISHFYGGEINESNLNTLNFPDGGYFVVSSINKEFMGKILMGLLDNPEISYGMKFMNIEHVNEQFMEGWNHFATLSPFIIKGKCGKNDYGKNDYSFLTIDGEYKRIDGKWNLIPTDNYDFQNVVKEHLSNKLNKIDESLNTSNIKVNINKLDKDGNKHNKHKVKKVYVNNVLNFANQCQLSIFCSKKIAEILYNIGIGQSTGAGFGTIYKTENHHLYRSKKNIKVGIQKSEILSEVV